MVISIFHETKIDDIIVTVRLKDMLWGKVNFVEPFYSFLAIDPFFLHPFSFL